MPLGELAARCPLPAVFQKLLGGSAKIMEFAVLIDAPQYLIIDPVIGMPEMVTNCRDVGQRDFGSRFLHSGWNVARSFADDFQKSLKTSAKKAVSKDFSEGLFVKNILDLIYRINNVAQPESDTICHQKT
jgi:hypothetical protein